MNCSRSYFSEMLSQNSISNFFLSLDSVLLSVSKLDKQMLFLT